jgi:hypothetical protein
MIYYPYIVIMGRQVRLYLSKKKYKILATMSLELYRLYYGGGM